MFAGNIRDVKEMKVHRSTLPMQPAWRFAWRRVQFSLGDARRALPYVSRVIRDASDAFGEVQDTRDQLRRGVRGASHGVLVERRDHAMRRLNSAIDEFNDIGADLLSVSEGRVRFNALIEGRPVSLLWQLGEPVTGAWGSLE